MKKFNSVRPAKRWCAVRAAQLVWCQGYPGLSRRVVEEGGGGVSYVQINEGMDGLMKSESTLLLPYHSPLFTKNGFIITRRYWLWFALCDALNFQCFVFPRALARKNVPYHQPPMFETEDYFCQSKNVRFWIFPTNEVINHLSKYLASDITTLFQPAEKSTKNQSFQQEITKAPQQKAKKKTNHPVPTITSDLHWKNWKLRFSLDTESGFKDVVFVTSAYGLGETVVGGTVNPDEWWLVSVEWRWWWFPEQFVILLMDKILHHLGWLKPYK